MKDMKAQSQVEMIIIIGVVLVVFLVFFDYSSTSVQSSESRIQMEQAEGAGIQVVTTAKKLYSEGVGAKTKIYISIPEMTKDITVSENLINTHLYAAGGVNDVPVNSEVDLCGDLPDEPGGHWIILEATESCVHIGEDVLGASPETVPFSIYAGGSDSQEVTVTNLGDEEARIEISIGRGDIPAGVIISTDISEITSLDPEADEDFEVQVSAAESTFPASYSGSITLTSYEGTDPTDTLTLSLPLTISVAESVDGGSLEIFPTAVDFGTFDLGETDSTSISICNKGVLEEEVVATLSSELLSFDSESIVSSLELTIAADSCEDETVYLDTASADANTSYSEKIAANGSSYAESGTVFEVTSCAEGAEFAILPSSFDFGARAWNHEYTTEDSTEFQIFNCQESDDTVDAVLSSSYLSFAEPGLEPVTETSLTISEDDSEEAIVYLIGGDAPEGTYSESITAGDAESGISFEVQPEEKITISPISFDFGAEIGGEEDSATFSICNSKSAQETVELALSSEDYLSLSESEVVVESGECEDVTVYLDSIAAPVDTYSETLTADEEESEITFEVLAGEITIEPLSFDFGAEIGGETDTTTFSICSSWTTEQTVGLSLSSENYLSLGSVEVIIPASSCEDVEVDLDSTSAPVDTYSETLTASGASATIAFEVLEVPAPETGTAFFITVINPEEDCSDVLDFLNLFERPFVEMTKAEGWEVRCYKHGKMDQIDFTDADVIISASPNSKDIAPIINSGKAVVFLRKNMRRTHWPLWNFPGEGKLYYHGFFETQAVEIQMSHYITQDYEVGELVPIYDTIIPRAIGRVKSSPFVTLASRTGYADQTVIGICGPGTTCEMTDQKSILFGIERPNFGIIDITTENVDTLWGRTLEWILADE